MSDAPPDDETEEDDQPPTVDLTDPKAQRRARDKIKREGQERESFWRSVLAHPVGRREVWRLIAGEEWGHAFNQNFACGPNGFPQPEATWFKAGEQNMALRLYHDLLRIDHDAVRLMHAENDARFAKPRRSARSRSDR